MTLRASHTLLIVLLAITGTHLNGQAFSPGYKFKHLNVQNGLAQNIVYHFLQDSRGYMWLGTHNGLTRYDGIRAINFLHTDEDKKSIAGNFITSILEDSMQQIWIGNENGIDLYIPAGNSFLHFGVDRPDGSKENTYCVILGFINADDKGLFRILLKVNGVGPKLALGILSSMSTDMLIQSIEMQDVNTLTRIPGVGKKTAERLIIELRDRLQVFAGSETSVAGQSQITLSAASPVAEAEAALVSLGYRPLEAQRAVAAIKHEHSDTADLIRAALKGMLKT